MKNLVIAAFCVCVISLVSCEDDEFASERIPSSGESVSEIYTINSRESKGFLLDELRLAEFPGSEADFIIIPQTGLTGDVMSPFLANPDLENRFILLSGDLTDVKSAVEYFASYTTYPEEQDPGQFALNLKPYQVWLIKSQSGVFFKVLILDTSVDKETSYVEIKFRAEKVL